MKTNSPYTIEHLERGIIRTGYTFPEVRKFAFNIRSKKKFSPTADVDYIVRVVGYPFLTKDKTVNFLTFNKYVYDIAKFKIRDWRKGYLYSRLSQKGKVDN